MTGCSVLSAGAQKPLCQVLGGSAPVPLLLFSNRAYTLRLARARHAVLMTRHTAVHLDSL